MNARRRRCVFTVSEAVTAELLGTCIGWVTEHVGTSVAPDDPVTAQLRVTTPVNPFSGIIVIFDVAVPPADRMLRFEPLSVNSGVGAGTGTVT